MKNNIPTLYILELESFVDKSAKIVFSLVHILVELSAGVDIIRNTSC